MDDQTLCQAELRESRIIHPGRPAEQASGAPFSGLHPLLAGNRRGIFRDFAMFLPAGRAVPHPASTRPCKQKFETMKTYMAKPAEVEPKWLLVDATDKVVGRLASDIAVRLMGKHRPTYTPHVDTGDFVVVVNAEKVKFTGNKWEKKRYTWYTGYPQQRSISAGERLERQPERILREAVRRMLPKNKLASQMLSKLKIYTGSNHPHQAQNPEVVELAVK